MSRVVKDSEIRNEEGRGCQALFGFSAYVCRIQFSFSFSGYTQNENSFYHQTAFSGMMFVIWLAA